MRSASAAASTMAAPISSETTSIGVKKKPRKETTSKAKTKPKMKATAKSALVKSTVKKKKKPSRGGAAAPVDASVISATAARSTQQGDATANMEAATGKVVIPPKTKESKVDNTKPAKANKLAMRSDAAKMAKGARPKRRRSKDSLGDSTISTLDSSGSIGEVFYGGYNDNGKTDNDGAVGDNDGINDENSSRRGNQRKTGAVAADEPSDDADADAGASRRGRDKDRDKSVTRKAKSRSNSKSGSVVGERSIRKRRTVPKRGRSADKAAQPAKAPADSAADDTKVKAKGKTRSKSKSGLKDATGDVGSRGRADAAEEPKAAKRSKSISKRPTRKERTKLTATKSSISLPDDMDLAILAERELKEDVAIGPATKMPKKAKAVKSANAANTTSTKPRRRASLASKKASRAKIPSDDVEASNRSTSLTSVASSVVSEKGATEEVMRPIGTEGEPSRDAHVPVDQLDTETSRIEIPHMIDSQVGKPDGISGSHTKARGEQQELDKDTSHSKRRARSKLRKPKDDDKKSALSSSQHTSKKAAAKKRRPASKDKEEISTHGEEADNGSSNVKANPSPSLPSAEAVASSSAPQVSASSPSHTAPNNARHQIGEADTEYGEADLKDASTKEATKLKTGKSKGADKKSALSSSQHTRKKGTKKKRSTQKEKAKSSTDGMGAVVGDADGTSGNVKGNSSSASPSLETAASLMSAPQAPSASPSLSKSNTDRETGQTETGHGEQEELDQATTHSKRRTRSKTKKTKDDDDKKSALSCSQHSRKKGVKKKRSANKEKVESAADDAQPKAGEMDTGHGDSKTSEEPNQSKTKEAGAHGNGNANPSSSPDEFNTQDQLGQIEPEYGELKLKDATSKESIKSAAGNSKDKKQQSDELSKSSSHHRRMKRHPSKTSKKSRSSSKPKKFKTVDVNADDSDSNSNSDQANDNAPATADKDTASAAADGESDPIPEARQPSTQESQDVLGDADVDKAVLPLPRDSKETSKAIEKQSKRGTGRKIRRIRAVVSKATKGEPGDAAHRPGEDGANTINGDAKNSSTTVNNKYNRGVHTAEETNYDVSIEEQQEVAKSNTSLDLKHALPSRLSPAEEEQHPQHFPRPMRNETDTKPSRGLLLEQSKSLCASVMNSSAATAASNSHLQSNNNSNNNTSNCNTRSMVAGTTMKVRSKAAEMSRREPPRHAMHFLRSKSSQNLGQLLDPATQKVNVPARPALRRSQSFTGGRKKRQTRVSEEDILAAFMMDDNELDNRDKKSSANEWGNRSLHCPPTGGIFSHDSNQARVTAAPAAADRGGRPKLERSKSFSRENSIVKAKWLMERVIDDDLNLSQHAAEMAFADDGSAMGSDDDGDDDRDHKSRQARESEARKAKASVARQDQLASNVKPLSHADANSKRTVRKIDRTKPHGMASSGRRSAFAYGAGDSDSGSDCESMDSFHNDESDNEELEVGSVDVFTRTDQRMSRTQNGKSRDLMSSGGGESSLSSSFAKLRRFQDDHSIKNFNDDYDDEESLMSFVKKPVTFVPGKRRALKKAPEASTPSSIREDADKESDDNYRRRPLQLGKPMDPSELRKMLNLSGPPPKGKNNASDDLPAFFRDDFNPNEALPNRFDLLVRQKSTPMLSGGGRSKSSLVGLSQTLTGSQEGATNLRARRKNKANNKELSVSSCHGRRSRRDWTEAVPGHPDELRSSSMHGEQLSGW